MAAARELPGTCRSLPLRRPSVARPSIIDAAIASRWLGYLITGFIGACLLIWIVRAIQGTRRPA